MPKITALVHAHNDELRIGRALESLRACDEILVIDHGSTDNTAKVAHEHGATVKKGVAGVNPGVYAIDARHDWIFCMLPTEAVSEPLEASLFEWKENHKDNSDEAENRKEAAVTNSYSVHVREDTGHGWRDLPPETRLVNREKLNWPGRLPGNDPQAELLVGDLLRFRKP